MKIHSVIFVIHLKQAKKDDFEKENSVNLTSDFIVMNEKFQYVVKKLLRREIKNEKSKYRVK